MEMKDKNKAKAIADERMRLIAPLLSPALDCAQIKQMKEELSKANGKHYRCISSLWDSPLYGNMRFWRVRTGGFMDDSCRRDRSKRFMMFTSLFFLRFHLYLPSCSQAAHSALS